MLQHLCNISKLISSLFPEHNICIPTPTSSPHHILLAVSTLIFCHSSPQWSIFPGQMVVNIYRTLTLCQSLLWEHHPYLLKVPSIQWGMCSCYACVIEGGNGGLGCWWWVWGWVVCPRHTGSDVVVLFPVDNVICCCISWDSALG